VNVGELELFEVVGEQFFDALNDSLFVGTRAAQLLELVGLADKGLDLRIQTETEQKNTTVDQQRQQRSQGRDKDLAALDAERQAVKAGISQDLDDKVTQRDAGVEQARAELDATLAEAKQKKADVQARVQGPGTPPVQVDLPDLDALRTSLDQIPATVTAEAQKLILDNVWRGLEPLLKR
jgi:hypothetical protein